MNRYSRHLLRAAPWLTALLILITYLATLAQVPVFGDPTEYTVVSATLSIAHPPGYAFFTLLGKAVQSLVPLGTAAWRMHLLAALGALTGALAVYGTVRGVAQRLNRPVTHALAAAAFAALALAFGADVWQHAIHANPHVFTGSFLGVNLFLLTRWWASRREAWLFLFSLSAGLGVTHHPLTVFAFPAYTLFILVVDPGILRRPRTLLSMVGSAVLGLTVWLYFPLRSPMGPVLGPSTMNTFDGFFNHILARGLTESLPYFGLADQPLRLVVFGTLLRLQYALTTLLLVPLGLFFLLRRPPATHPSLRPLALLYGLGFLGPYAFVISLQQQDIMAYLLGPFMVIALLAGFGLLALLGWSARFLRGPQLALLAGALLLLGPVLKLARQAQPISLRDFDAAPAYVAAVEAQFFGSGDGATLLNNWEHMTPFWYRWYVENSLLPADDLRIAWISAGADNPWLQSVFRYLPAGPLYVYDFRPEIIRGGFRLRPRGAVYQVVEPGEATLPPELTPLSGGAGEINIRGYLMPQRTATAGDYLPLTLAMSAPITPTDFYVPVVQIGDISYPFTTDSHLPTPFWVAGEVIVERFDLALPLDLPAGRYPVTLDLKNLSSDTLLPLGLDLGTLDVTAHPDPPATAALLANFRQRVGLAGATARQGLQRRSAPWQEPLTARPGDAITINLDWRSLAPAEESYTVFVHLIDLENRPLLSLDYTPLGGAAPTHLWIPKWLPGQTLRDPYRMDLPSDLPPGTYLIEAGLYEMTGLRRLHMQDAAGNLVGDRYILGAVTIGN